MIRNRRTLRAAVLGTALLAGLSGGSLRTAQAGSEEMLNNMFGVFTSTTNPQSLDTQRRGGVTLGSVMVRTRVVAPNYINFDPPSINGGCSGIDLYGGSFSFINKDQLTQALRAIASNALSYAFTLALEGVCPTCMQKMNDLRDMVDRINKEMKDSCRWGQALVNRTGLNEWHESRIAEANNKNRERGAVEDAFDATFRFVSTLQSDIAVSEPTPANAVWAAMNSSGVAAWFGGFGDTEMKEVVMSVTGTIIKSETDSDGNACTTAEGENEYCFREAPPTLDLQDFIEGGMGGPVKMYQCDESTNCLNPTVADRDWKGLKHRVRVILFGPAPSFSGGLVYKMRDRTADLTTQELAFISNAPIPVYTILRSVAKYPGAVMSVGEHLQELIASTLARGLVLELIASVRHSFTSEQQQMSAQMHKLLTARTEEFAIRSGQENTRMQEMAQFMQLVDLVKRDIAQTDETPGVVAANNNGIRR